MDSDPTIINIPSSKWVKTIEVYTEQFGRPTLSPPDSPVAEADRATWEIGSEELQLVKTSENDFIEKDGNETLIQFDNLDTATSFFKAMTKIFSEKEPIHPIRIFSIFSRSGNSKIAIGTFYYYKNEAALARSETGGVIHNPPDKRAFKKKHHRKHKSPKGTSGLLIGGSIAVGFAALYYLFTKLEE